MANEDVRTTRHQLFLEALRHREQEVFRYLAILGPALGGFVWLATKYPKDITTVTFCVAAIGLQGLVLLGAWYAAALGYNYRCITMLLSKEEKTLGLTGAALEAWADEPGGSGDRTTLGHYFHRARGWAWLSNQPWCFPPELVAVFWWAFLVCTAFLTVATLAICDWGWAVGLAAICGVGVFVLSLVAPWHFGKKLRSVREKEASAPAAAPVVKTVRPESGRGEQL